MMRIFVLEDDLMQQGRMRRIISNYTNKYFITGKPQELLDRITEFGNHQLYFLDIHIKNHSKCGLEIAQIIRERDPFGVIVFTTSYSDFAVLTYEYKVAAFDFIDKNTSSSVFAERVIECIKYVEKFQHKDIDQDQIIIKNRYTSFKVPFKSILYFETTDPHRIQLVLVEKTIEFFGKLSEIENLDDRLFRCHKSYIVNIMNVVEVDHKEKKILFDNDRYCWISKRKFKQFQEKLHASLKEDSTISL